MPGIMDLEYVWEAELNDGSVIRQFEANGKENLFNLVLEEEKKGNLRWFSLIGRNIKFIVDLHTGLFYLNGLCPLEKEMAPEDKGEYKLIYFRRVTRQTLLGSQIKELGVSRLYFLGWSREFEGEQIKRVLQIHPNGRVVFK